MALWSPCIAFAAVELVTVTYCLARFSSKYSISTNFCGDADHTRRSGKAAGCHSSKGKARKHQLGLNVLFSHVKFCVAICVQK